uniref:RING-type domain-containing protein n=1 Tax=Rhodosorus marinus TaxID=101924 RepID=A0A7S0BFG0_9RHOD|mmetsp:Transcript_12941/g.18605  ORF Transcript_12941/g.18605 Transcript_12941/m.18605 type:complete len:133 (+) Transcript_12941:204-602(+)
MASYFDDHDVTEDQIPTGGLDPQFVEMLERMNQLNFGERMDEQASQWITDVTFLWPDLLQNMTVTSENPPTSNEVIENLPEVPVEAHPAKGGKLACPICTDEFQAKAIELQCKHLFHRHCIVPWLEKVMSTQ